MKDLFTSNHPILGLIGKFLAKYMPNLAKGCPFQGYVNITGVELEKIGHEYFPPAFVTGTFLVKIRNYAKITNETIMEEKYIFEVKNDNIFG